MKTTFYIVLLCSFLSFSQKSSFDKMIDSTLKKTVPFIHTSVLAKNYADYIILDTRELEEYNISHLENAKHIGYNEFNYRKIKKEIATKKPIVVYCSIGYRSEKIGEKLLKKGYTVYNLYGGIFDWKNKDNTIVNNSGVATNKLHCFNQEWSKWAIKGDKVYSKQQIED